MKATEITRHGSRLCVDAPYHPEIVNRLRQCGGEFDKATKFWWVDAAQGDKLLDLLPKASYSYDALCACWDAQEARIVNFAQSLIRMGVQLVLDGCGSVVAVGEAVSPLLQQLVAERSDDLREWVDIAQPVVTVTDADVAQVEVTRGDRLIHAGMQNAAKREQGQREMQARMVRRRILEQRELFEGEWDG